MKSSLEKLNRIRGLMNERGIDVYVIPLNDPHLGEYIPDHWRIIEWLTGFSGSAATVVITDLFAGLWTDSRYYIQADSQLIGSGCTFMKQSHAEKQNFIEWLLDNIKNGSKIALDGRTFS